MLKVTTPSQMATSLSELEIAIQKFEDRWQYEIKGNSYYMLLICGELTRTTCIAVEDLYKASGWNFAKCITSTENGERPGLTRLELK